jgi:hypothetical protein
LTCSIRYPVGASAAAAWRLSSDTSGASLPAGRSMHGDWMDGREPKISDA